MVYHKGLIGITVIARLLDYPRTLDQGMEEEREEERE
jgi:hypothetical protein